MGVASRINAMPAILFGALQTRHESNGGVESATRIFEALHGRFSWLLLTNRETPRTARWRQLGAKISLISFDEEAPRLKRRLQGLGWTARFAYEIIKRRPALVHLNDIQSFQVFSYLPKKLSPRFLFTLRDTREPGTRYGPIWKKLVSRADSIVVLSDEMAEMFSHQLPEAREKTRVINSIVDLTDLTPASTAERASARRKLRIPPDQLAIGCIGAIRDKKGQLAFIQNGLPKLVRQLPHAHVHFIGDSNPEGDPYVGEVIAAVNHMDARASATLHGHTSEVKQWYKALDIVLIAANYEGLARAMIESMSAGIPVVSTAVCSAREMLQQSGAGLVVPIGDQGGLVSSLAAFADPDRRRKAGAIGRDVAEQRFSEEVVAGQFAALYDTAINRT